MALRQLAQRFRFYAATRGRAAMAASSARGRKAHACAAARVGAVRAEGEAVAACAEARARAAHACAAARVRAIRAEGEAVVACAQARARAAHAYALTAHRKAGVAAALAGTRLRRAHDRTFASIYWVAYGESAPKTPSPMEVLDHMLMLLERAKSIHYIWKAIQNMIDEPRDIHPVIQAFIIVIYVSPLYALVKGLVTTAPEPVCPFLGIQGLSFDECPAKDALLEVLTLASSSCGVVVMSAGGICICLFIDILSKFEVNEVLVMESQTMEHMIEDDCDGSIMLPNVNSKILSKVIEWKQFQMRDAAAAPDADTGSKSTDVELEIFDEEFIKAATYLDMKVLLDLTCQSVSDMIKGKTPDEIGTTFDIKHDFSTPEEKEQVRR